MHAEQAYTFQHAVLRDAAYQMQMPAARANLHRLAVEVIEKEAGDSLALFAFELAQHCRACSDIQHDGSLKGRELRYTRMAAERAETQYRFHAARELWSRLAEICDSEQQPDAIFNAGKCALTTGSVLEAEKLLNSALESATSANLPDVIRAIHSSLGSLYLQTGREDMAEEILEGVLENTTDMRLSGVVLGNLAILNRLKNRPEKAEQYYEEVRQIANQLEDAAMQAKAIVNLAILYRITGRISKAEESYRQGLAIAHELGDARMEAAILGNWGTLYATGGKVEQAQKLYMQAVDLSRKVGDRRSLGIRLCSLGEATLDLNDYGNAREYWLEGWAVLIDAGYNEQAKGHETAMLKFCKQAGLKPFTGPLATE